ncbi:hypothetical protein BP5796_11877 [Coleophoma crateriformis]|uniref:Mid2 domain-containing protein n=1 Tax=Coleophoma crateriformis TaxID=565419 RepID=A0A3D8QEZ6_9HELO|nr:hypothetical protein BP5796_11877 [Coleophoma crateriformis]
MSCWAILCFAFLTLSAAATHHGNSVSGMEMVEGNKPNLKPVEAIQHILEDGTEFVETHIQWIVDLSHDKGHSAVNSSPATIVPSVIEHDLRRSHITAAPLLHNRAALPNPQVPAINCGSQVDAAKSDDAKILSATVAAFSSQSLKAVASAQAAQASAQSVASAANAAATAASSSLVSVQTSASAALQAASQSLAAATSASAAAVLSASSAIASASTSASAAIASVTSSANAAVAAAQSSASNAVAQAQSSASQSVAMAVSSASSVASAAQATATLAIQQAKETISNAAIQAAASVRQSQVTAVTATTAAIAIVGSIIGSSLLSIFAYFLLSRYRNNKEAQRRREYEESRDEEKSRRNSMDSNYPRSRRGSEARSRSRGPSQSRSRRGSEARSRRGSDATLSDRKARDTRRDTAFTISAFPLPNLPNNTEGEDRTQVKTPKSSRPTLIYDPENPTRPPTFIGGDGGDEESEESYSSFVLERVPDENSKQSSTKNKRGWIGAAV